MKPMANCAQNPQTIMLSRSLQVLGLLLMLFEILRLAVWLSGNVLASINVVVILRARLVPGWVIVFWRVNHLGV